MAIEMTNRMIKFILTEDGEPNKDVFMVTKDRIIACFYYPSRGTLIIAIEGLPDAIEMLVDPNEFRQLEGYLMFGILE
jgi:hypothetical protein